MKKFNVELKHYDAFKNKVFSVVLPDYFNNASVRDIVYPAIKGRYGYSIHVTQSSDDIPPTCSSVEGLLNAVKNTKLWSRKETKEYGDLVEVPVEVKEFHLPKCFKVTECDYNINCGNMGITFFRIGAQCPFGIATVVLDNVAEELDCKISRNGYYYIHDEWKFEQDKDDPTLWKAMRTELKREVVSTTIVYKQL